MTIATPCLLSLLLSPARTLALALGLPFALALALTPGCVQPVRPFATETVTAADGRPLLRPAASGSGLVVDDRSPVPDVPVPLRFVLIPARSAAFASAGTGQPRDVTHVYEGRADYDQLAAFFSRELSRHGWRPDPAGPASGPIRAYLKGPERLHLSLSEARGVATIALRIAAAPARTP